MNFSIVVIWTEQKATETIKWADEATWRISPEKDDEEDGRAEKKETSLQSRNIQVRTR